MTKLKSTEKLIEKRNILYKGWSKKIEVDGGGRILMNPEYDEDIVIDNIGRMYTPLDFIKAKERENKINQELITRINQTPQLRV